MPKIYLRDDRLELTLSMYKLIKESNQTSKSIPYIRQGAVVNSKIAACVKVPEAFQSLSGWCHVGDSDFRGTAIWQIGRLLLRADVRREVVVLSDLARWRLHKQRFVAYIIYYVGPSLALS